MTNWSGFEAAEPELARAVRERFGKYRHQVLATVRSDGSPRVTGLEAIFWEGELCLGMMPRSRKALDLQRDPRFALHANPGTEDLTGGEADVRVSGRAVEFTDPAVLARFAQSAEPPEPFHLFRTELTEVVRIGIDNDELVIRIWQPGRPVRTVRRGNDEASLREE